MKTLSDTWVRMREAVPTKDIPEVQAAKPPTPSPFRMAGFCMCSTSQAARIGKMRSNIRAALKCAVANSDASNVVLQQGFVVALFIGIEPSDDDILARQDTSHMTMIWAHVGYCSLSTFRPTWLMMSPTEGYASMPDVLRQRTHLQSDVRATRDERFIETLDPNMMWKAVMFKNIDMQRPLGNFTADRLEVVVLEVLVEARLIWDPRKKAMHSKPRKGWSLELLDDTGDRHRRRGR